MSEPIVLHVARPYRSVDEYLAHEAWTLDPRWIVLVDQPELPRDTVVAFDLTLADGSRPIRAEGRVLGMEDPADGRPGGLRVRFKRYGASTKALIERAAQLGQGGTAEFSPEPPSAVTASELGSRPSEGSAPAAAPPPFAPSPSAPQAAAEPVSPPADTGAPEPLATGGFQPVPVTVPPVSSPNVPAALAALRARAGYREPVPEVPDRDFLLEKLRQRGQNEDVTTRYQRDLG
jgi:hypothetical protein